MTLLARADGPLKQMRKGLPFLIPKLLLHAYCMGVPCAWVNGWGALSVVSQGQSGSAGMPCLPLVFTRLVIFVEPLSPGWYCP